MKKIVISCVVSACFAFSTTLIAATNPASPTAAQMKTPKSTEQVQSMYKGIIKKSNNGTALITEDKTYQLDGGDFSKMVGKAVNIIGKVTKDGKKEKLTVAKLEIQ